MIKQIPEAERPRERCLAHGAETLSLRECLAVVLGSGPAMVGCLGLAARVLGQAAPGRGSDPTDHEFLAAWAHAGPALLRGIKGLGPAQEARLLACLEIANRSRRLASKAKRRRGALRLGDVEAKALRRISATRRAQSREWLGFIPVDRDGRVGPFYLVEQGSRTHVNVDRQRLFLEILLSRAAAFVLAHNHPSGDLEPSIADRLLTEEVSRVAEQLGVQCLSHLIVTAREAVAI